MVYVGGNDGMLHAFDDSTTRRCRQGNLGVRTQGALQRRRPERHRPHAVARIPARCVDLSCLAAFRSSRTSSTSTPRRAYGTSISPTRTRRTRRQSGQRLAHDPGRRARRGRAVQSTRSMSRSRFRSTDTESVDRDHRGACCGSSPTPTSVTSSIAPTLVKTYRVRLGGARRVGIQQSGRQGHPVRARTPTDGTILKKLSTGVGNDTDPSGLSTIRAFTPSRKDPYVLQAYGGDLIGNVWRFDLSDPDCSKWKVERIAKLTDASGKEQPITTGVRIEIDQNNNVDRYLFVGTGKLLGDSDLSDTSVGNTLYVIRDGTRTAPDPAPATPYSRADLNAGRRDRIGRLHRHADRPWLVSGRPRQVAEDRHRRIRGRADRRLRVLEAERPIPASGRCPRRCTRAISLTGNSVLVSEGGGVVPVGRHRRRHRGRRVDPGSGRCDRRRFERRCPGPGHDDEGSGLQLRRQARRCRESQAPGFLATAEPRLAPMRFSRPSRHPARGCPRFPC